MGVLETWLKVLKFNFVFIVLFRLCSLAQDTDSHPATAVLHNPSVASKENVSNFILKSSLKHSSCRRRPGAFPFPLFFVSCFSSRLTSGLKEIFSYPAGMHIKTPEFDSFLDEVCTNHWINIMLHRRGNNLCLLKNKRCPVYCFGSYFLMISWKCMYLFLLIYNINHNPSLHCGFKRWLFVFSLFEI